MRPETPIAADTHRRIVHLLRTGFNAYQVAARLGISRHTVRRYRWRPILAGDSSYPV